MVTTCPSGSSALYNQQDAQYQVAGRRIKQAVPKTTVSGRRTIAAHRCRVVLAGELALSTFTGFANSEASHLLGRNCARPWMLETHQDAQDLQTRSLLS
jgi:hypothetical protein